MKRSGNKECGLLSLEASIAVTIFIFLMLFMYSFFVVFEARNEIGHVLLSTADSLGLDAYSSNSLDDDNSLQGIIYGIYGHFAKTDGTFTETEKWFEDETKVEDVVRDRFLSYLAGGDITEADRILDELNVVGGFDGLDFSKSKVDGDDIVVTVEYELEYEFKVFNLANNAFSQTCSSKLWK